MMRLLFRTGHISHCDGSASVLPVSLNELRELYFDPDFSEPIEIDLILTVDEERFLFATQFLIMYTTSSVALQRIAKDLEVRLTHKDLKVGNKRVLLRIMEYIEKSDRFDRFQFHIKNYYLKNEVIHWIKKMNCESVEDWVQIKSKMAPLFMQVDAARKDAEERWKLIKNELDDEQLSEVSEDRYWKEFEELITIPIAIGFSFFSIEIFSYWREWLQKDPTVPEHSYNSRLVDMINDWLVVVGKKKPLDATAELKRLKQRQREMEAQHQIDLEYLQSSLVELQERARKMELGEVTSLTSAGSFGALQSKRILIVGDDSHKTAYRQMVEMYGAEFDFVSGFEKDAQAVSRFGWADGVILVTAYTDHAKWYALKAHVSMEKLVLVNRAGVAAMDEGLKALAVKLGTKASA